MFGKIWPRNSKQKIDILSDELDKTKQEFEEIKNQVGALQNAMLACLLAVFNIGEKAGLFIRCYECSASITTINNKLPAFDINKNGFRCSDCINKTN